MFAPEEIHDTDTDEIISKSWSLSLGTFLFSLLLFYRPTDHGYNYTVAVNSFILCIHISFASYDSLNVVLFLFPFFIQIFYLRHFSKHTALFMWDLLGTKVANITLQW